MTKINWNKLNKYKESIKMKRKRDGLQSAVYFAEGILGLKRGEYLKNRPRIKRIIKGF